MLRLPRSPGARPGAPLAHLAAALLAALACAGAPTAVEAGNRPRLLAAVDVAPVNDVRTVIVRLSCPVTALDVFPPDRGSSVEIQLEVLPGCALFDGNDLERELIEPRRSARELIDTVVLERRLGGAPTVTIRFLREMRGEAFVDVRADKAETAATAPASGG